MNLSSRQSTPMHWVGQDRPTMHLASPPHRLCPLCEIYVAADKIDQMEPYYPLHVLVCGGCFLVQLGEYVKPEHIFREYAYFSSYSTTWVQHALQYCEMVMVRFDLGSNSRVFEIGSNDGYLLQHFLPL